MVVGFPGEQASPILQHGKERAEALLDADPSGLRIVQRLGELKGL